MRAPLNEKSSKPIANLSSFKKLVPYIGMLLLANLLWLPFSFKTMGLVEELGVENVLDQGHPLFFITPDSPMNSHRARPLEVFFHTLSYELDHDSYLYYNIFQMLLIYGKMVAAYWLVLEFLPHRKVLGFIIGLLFILYPADTGNFTFRTIHIHASVLTYLLAFYVSILYYKGVGRGRFKLALMSGFLAFSLLEYQIALAAALITPFFLLYFGLRKRRLGIVSGVWYATVLFSALYSLWAISQVSTQSYDQTFLDTLSSGGGNDINSILYALLLGYQRQFTSWTTAVGKLISLEYYWSYVLIGLVLSLFIGWWLLKQQQDENPTEPVKRWQLLVLLLSGVGFFAVGMATYLPIANHRLQDFRTYFLAMFGSALVLGLLLYLVSRILSRHWEKILILLSLPFITLGLVNAFYLHQYYVNNSLIQQSILQQIVKQAPELQPDILILINDKTDLLNQEYVFYFGVYTEMVLRYLYQDPTLQVVVCPEDGGFNTQSIQCKMNAKNLELITKNANNDANVTSVSYNRVLLFETNDDHLVKLVTPDEAAAELGIEGYDPQAHILSQTPPPRALTLFSCEPALSCFRKDLTQREDTYILPTTGTIGVGWRDPEFSPDSGVIFRWSITNVSTVKFNLISNSDFSLTFKMVGWLNNNSVNGLKLTVNGQDIPLTYEVIQPAERMYSATIPQSVLVGYPSKTKLIFTIDKISPVPEVPTVSLGWALSDLTIKPINS
jgi:hypothetical protein